MVKKTSTKKRKNEQKVKPVKCSKCRKFASRKKSYVTFDSDGFHYTHPKCVGNLFQRGWLTLKNFIKSF